MRLSCAFKGIKRAQLNLSREKASAESGITGRRHIFRISTNHRRQSSRVNDHQVAPRQDYNQQVLSRVNGCQQLAQEELAQI